MCQYSLDALVKEKPDVGQGDGSDIDALGLPHFGVRPFVLQCDTLAIFWPFEPALI